MASPLSAVRSARTVAGNVAGKRYLSDVTITRTGKPIIRTEGGRSSLGGHTATVFGATGQLGRYIVNRLARQGNTVIIPFREEMAKRHLKVAGDLGRIVFMEYDLHNTASIEASIRHSDVVYNLIGRDYPTKNFSLEDVHVEGTERIVETVAKYDVDRYIHVSSHSANPESKSEFYATKGRGELVARRIFPETTIVRPAPLFGFEDRLLLRLASALNLFTSNNMQERFRPVHSIDVGAALEKMLYDDTTAGQTFELYGPREYSMAEIAAMVDKEIFKKRRHFNVPKVLMQPIADVLNKVLWFHTTSGDEVEREYMNQVIDPQAKTFKDLGIEPGDISNFTYHYLQGFRSSSFYDLPPATEKEKREENKYIHVLDDPNSLTSLTKNQFQHKFTGLLFSVGRISTFCINPPAVKRKQTKEIDNVNRTLSSHALAALAEFNAEKDAHTQRFEKLKTQAEADGPVSMDDFAEDWNESQFWYSEETARILANQLLDGATAETTIGVLSAPSAFVALKNMVRGRPESERPKLVLLEHDDRFGMFPEFVFYDFNEPFKLPATLKGSLDCIICDPPFLNEDCQAKSALTARWLLKASGNGAQKPRVIVCTGERMETLILKLYQPYGVRTTTFEPRHKGGLSNEFYSYASFECEDWKWRQ
ncbi:putative N6-adenine methyltransferase-domain-containing protein [Stachybotrys elegans]|uniref:Protein-lysine N-methyltransferase EFM5 n=1 Tax=Stachybotrys elegans TaxID=80388 RepID=A0A8K0SZI7_9HYPO|nr:putative N6-adenine methyltransferase-domain-containing protein [Stachybotrys elegans]